MNAKDIWKMGRYMLTRRKLFSDDEIERYAIERILNSCSALEYDTMLKQHFGFKNLEGSSFVLVESKCEIDIKTSEPLAYRSIVIFRNEVGMRLFLYMSGREYLTYDVYSTLVN